MHLDNQTSVLPNLITHASNPDKMTQGSWVIVRMASGNEKLARLLVEHEPSWGSGSAKASTQSKTPIPAILDMGKFGSCYKHELLGCYYSVPLFVLPDKRVRPCPEGTGGLVPTPSDIHDEANNSTILDDPATQSLAYEAIHALKQANSEGRVSTESVIQTLCNNNASFAKRTAFSQAKYIKRKQKKFSRVFLPIKPTARQLCDYFFKKTPAKTRHLRVDTLSQILTAGNIQPGGKVLVVDEGSGLMVAAILERMAGHGQVLQMVEHDSFDCDIPKYLVGYESTLKETLNYLSWSRMTKQADELGLESELLSSTPSSMEMDVVVGDVEEATSLAPSVAPDMALQKRHAAFAKRLERFSSARAILHSGHFNSLILSCDFPIPQVLTALLPYLAGSASIVVYAAAKEQLTDAFLWCRRSPSFVNVQLQESWMREYSLPTSGAGTHPTMSTSGCGGYLLTAIRVLNE